jgi:hypothetical protein
MGERQWQGEPALQPDNRFLVIGNWIAPKKLHFFTAWAQR